MKNIIAGILVVVLAFAVPAYADSSIPYGVNIGCGSCGSGNVYGTNYIYTTNTEIDMAYNQGVRVLRLGFWQSRVISAPDGTVLTPVANRLLPNIDYALSKGMAVILDDHEFGSYFGGVMTSSDVPATVRMWSQVFGKYKGNPNVLPAFMNEPFKLYSSVWSIEQAWIDGMRNDGWTQTLVVSGRNFSPLSGYGRTFGASALTLTDPLNGLLFDGHIYFDSDSSGTHGDVMGLTDADLADPVAFEGKVRTWLNNRVGSSMTWARNNGKKFLVGEIALPNNNVGNAARPIVVKYFDENSDVIQHMTWWALSSWANYPGYIFGLSQSGGAPSPIFLETTKARQAIVP